jgi:hypothetical protein
MFADLLQGSLAVLRRPTVPTFLHHKREAIGWATLYVVLGTLIAVGLDWLDYQVDAPYTSARVADLRGQISQLESPSLDMSGVIGQPSLAASLTRSVLSSLFGFGVLVGVVHLVRRLVGGSGSIVGLAYVIALYWPPMAVLVALAMLMFSGPLSWFQGVAILLLSLYNLFLTSIAMQAGLNLTSRCAGLVVLLLVALGLLLVSVLAAVLVAVLSSVVNGVA